MVSMSNQADQAYNPEKQPHLCPAGDEGRLPEQDPQSLESSHPAAVNPDKETLLSRFIGIMDIAGVFASTVCTIHCLLLPIVVVALPMLAKPLVEHDIVHVSLAGFVFLFCLTAYLPGYLKHRDKRLIFIGILGVSLVFFATFMARVWGEIIEAAIITAGNTIIIFGHLLNRKLLEHSNCKH